MPSKRTITLTSLELFRQRLTEDLEKFQKRQSRNLSEIQRRLPLRINVVKTLKNRTVSSVDIEREKENVTYNNKTEVGKEHQAISYVQNEGTVATENDVTADNSEATEVSSSEIRRDSSCSSSCIDELINNSCSEKTSATKENKESSISTPYKQNEGNCISFVVFSCSV